MKQLQSIVLLIGLLSITTGFRSFAVVIPIQNSSFEEPLLAPGETYRDQIDIWTVTGGGGVAQISEVVPQVSIDDKVRGEQMVFAHLSSFSIEQLSGVTAQADQRYLLYVDLMPTLPESERSWAKVTLNSGGDSPTIFAQALCRAPEAVEREDFKITEASWSSVLIEFSTFDHPEWVGQPINIRLEGGFLRVDSIELHRIPVPAVNPAPHDYYISQSMGDDSSDGLTEMTAWQSFDNLAGLTLQPGDRVLLQRGDVWSDELRIGGEGNPQQPIELGAWGAGPRPRIVRHDPEADFGVVVEGASFFEIRHLDVRNAKLGLYLRYISDNHNRDVLVEDCYFQDMPSWAVENERFNYEISFGSGIFVGGRMGWGNDQFRTVLQGLTIRRCQMRNVCAGFNTAWFFPYLYRSRLRNVTIEDTYATRVAAGAIVAHTIDGFIIRNFRSFEPNGGTESFIWGSAGGLLSACVDTLIEDCEFADTDRMWLGDEQWGPDEAGDGCGFDIDGFNEYVTVTDTVFHHNESNGLLFLSTYGEINRNILINNTTHFNNGLDGAVTFGGQNFGIKANGSLVGSFSNIGLYRSAPSWGWIDPATSSNVGLDQIRYNYFSDVSARSTAWDFSTAGSDLGWNQFSADWSDQGVNGEGLQGLTTGPDPYVTGPLTWAPSHRNGTVVIRMRSDTDAMAQLYFVTETDPVWDGEKSIAFAITGDDQMHQYTLDMSALAEWRGVITQLRLDPTLETGMNFNIESVHIEPRPWIVQANVVDAQTVDIFFNEMMQPDAENPLAYSVVTNQGSMVSPQTVTFMGDRHYRLQGFSFINGQALLPAVVILQPVSDIDNYVAFNPPLPPRETHAKGWINYR